MGDPKAVCDDSEIGDVRAVKGGAPSAKTSMLPKLEVRMYTVTL